MKDIWWLSCNQTCIADVVAKSSAVWWVGEGGSGVKKAQVGSALLLLPPNNSHKFSQNFLLSIFSFFINLIFVKKGLYFSENGLPFAGIGLYFLKMDFTVEVLSLVAIVLLRVSTGQWASFLAKPHHKWLLLVQHHQSTAQLTEHYMATLGTAPAPAHQWLLLAGGQAWTSSLCWTCFDQSPADKTKCWSMRVLPNWMIHFQKLRQTNVKWNVTNYYKIGILSQSAWKDLQGSQKGLFGPLWVLKWWAKMSHNFVLCTCEVF